MPVSTSSDPITVGPALAEAALIPILAPGARPECIKNQSIALTAGATAFSNLPFSLKFIHDNQAEARTQMVRAFVFPGQGSQAVGMGQRLAEASPVAREVFEEVDEALGQRLTRLMFEGPQEELTLTANAQPALMAVSVALVRTLERDGGKRLADVARYVAGHSLGEYSALAAAGALSLSDTARLLRLRGEAMQAAVPVGEGAMAALLGLEIPAVEEIVAAASAVGVCAMLAALADIRLDEPVVSLIANVTAAPVTDPEEIRRLLVEQVTATVRWRECVLAMKELGVDTLVEMGGGKVLTGMVRRIDREMTGVSVEGPDEIEALLGTL